MKNSFKNSLIVFTLGISFMLMSCAAKVAPSINIEKDIFNAGEWQLAVIDLNYEVEGEGQVFISKTRGGGQDGGSIVAGLLSSEFSRLNNVTVIERGQIESVLEEQALQLSGVISSKEALKVGKLLGANAVLVGDLSNYVTWENVLGWGSTVAFSVRMIEVGSGKVILNSAISRARNNHDIFANCQVTAKEMVDKIIKAL